MGKVSKGEKRKSGSITEDDNRKKCTRKARVKLVLFYWVIVVGCFKPMEILWDSPDVPLFPVPFRSLAMVMFKYLTLSQSFL